MPENSIDTIEYISYGKCLVVGNQETIGVALSQCTWPDEIERIYVVVGKTSEKIESLLDRGEFEIVKGDEVILDGHLGDYQLHLSLGKGSGQGILPSYVLKSDLILDLMAPPLNSSPVKPFGYFQVGGDPGEIQAQIESLGEWVGVFEKPKYFDYQEDLCAHGHGRLTGCHACLDVCATQAIQSTGDKIVIDPYLCQGCGDCSSVCPSGAMNFVMPPRDRILEYFQQAMAGNEGKQVKIVATSDSESRGKGDDIIEVEVGAVGAFGPELWLAIVANGARGVLLSKKGLNDLSIDQLESQMEWANELLSGLGYGSKLVGWDEEANSLSVSQWKGNEATGIVPLKDKRDVLNLALHRLCSNAPAEDAEVIRLPKTAPLGGIIVDTENCTLCMSCVNVCPAGALTAGNDQPLLGLVENKCVQCGMCREACPESVIQLDARLMVDREAASTVQVLHREDVFRCIECGKPFANVKMIETVLGKVSGHPMFSSEAQRRRLKMCENCRVLSMMEQK